MPSRLHNVHWLWLSLLVIVGDQFTKLLVVRSLQKFAVVPLVDHLNLVRMQNTGAAFSMFHTAPAAVFVLLSAGVSLGIVWWLRRNPHAHRLVAAAFALILGGALGNAIDRATRGSVVDFVDFYVGGWHFAAFNLADSAITIGAGLLILDMLLESRRPAGTA
ncbi:MAG: signal peptidase II [Nevskia sp.]|nr:signal peptidase II [Nevskia sp.]